MEAVATEINPPQAVAKPKSQPVQIVLPDESSSTTETPSGIEVKTIQVIRDKNLETKTMPVIRDPKVFLEGFLKSDNYKKGYEQFYQGKTVDPETTDEDRVKAFLNFDDGKLALMEYGDNVVHLEWDPYQYPMEARKAVSSYIKSAEEHIKSQTRDEQYIIKSYDDLRKICHIKASQALVDSGIAPTEKIGRAIATLILVDKNLDTFQNAKVKDADRVRNVVSATSKGRMRSWHHR